jgi:hypothetical protein
MRRLRFPPFAAVALVATSVAAGAQATRDLSLPPPYDTPMLPPAVNPTLPPPSGQRYLPGTGGAYGDPDRTTPVVRLPRRAPAESLRGEIRLSQLGAKSTRIERASQVGPHLRSCWIAPGSERPSEPLDATIRFSLRHDGALIGEPRVTYVNQKATPAQRDAIVASIRAALARCAPMPLADSLGAAIAGRPISIRFIFNAPATGA